MANFSITQNGKPLDPKWYTWDEENKVLTTKAECLTIDFSNMDYCTLNLGNFCNVVLGDHCEVNSGYLCNFLSGDDCKFHTRKDCSFKTGSSCTFDTGNFCTFNADNFCTFNTGDCCTFKTGNCCTFNTGNYCTFNTGSDCVFTTVHTCTFDTNNNCTFDTDDNCTFRAGSDCTFRTGNSCSFITDDNCTFRTANYCIFSTGWNCTFNAGLGCTFDTGCDCNFNIESTCVLKIGGNCVIEYDISWVSKGVVVRRDVHESYEVKHKKVTTAPTNIKGYVADGYYYVDGEKQYEGIIADGILSEVIEHKGNVYKVINHGEEETSYLVQDGDLYAHGETVQKAKENLIYKISNRDTSKYEDYTLDTKISFEDAIKMYRVITGACESGTKYFMNNILHERDKKYEYTVKEVIELTKGQYGNEKLVEFFKVK